MAAAVGSARWPKVAILPLACCWARSWLGGVGFAAVLVSFRRFSRPSVSCCAVWQSTGPASRRAEINDHGSKACCRFLHQQTRCGTGIAKAAARVSVADRLAREDVTVSISNQQEDHQMEASPQSGYRSISWKHSASRKCSDVRCHASRDATSPGPVLSSSSHGHMKARRFRD